MWSVDRSVGWVDFHNNINPTLHADAHLDPVLSLPAAGRAEPVRHTRAAALHLRSQRSCVDLYVRYMLTDRSISSPSSFSLSAWVQCTHVHVKDEARRVGVQRGRERRNVLD